MKIGFIGLGKMGQNMVLNLLDNKHEVVVYNRSPMPVKHFAKLGAEPSQSIDELAGKLPRRKIVWIMISAGKPVDEVIGNLLPKLSIGDIIIDGGNSYFRDSIRRYMELKTKGVEFLDCGVSGGVAGARNGACMMVGGNKKTFEKVEKLFRDLSVKQGYGYMGKNGSGHFVKMVHNGIEYGMMGAISEGVETLKEYPLGIDVKKAVEVYSHGSIIESQLIKWLLEAMENKGKLNAISGEVPLGETEKEMENLEKIAKMTVLREARMMRVNTRKVPRYAGKLVAAMRNQFGGHEVVKKRGVVKNLLKKVKRK